MECAVITQLIYSFSSYISNQELKKEIENRDAIIAADKAQLAELLAKIAELTASMETLKTEKAAQDEEIKVLQVSRGTVSVSYTIPKSTVREASHLYRQTFCVLSCG